MNVNRQEYLFCFKVLFHSVFGLCFKKQYYFEEVRKTIFNKGVLAINLNAQLKINKSLLQYKAYLQYKAMIERAKKNVYKL